MINANIGDTIVVGERDGITWSTSSKISGTRYQEYKIVDIYDSVIIAERGGNRASFNRESGARLYVRPAGQIVKVIQNK